MNIRNIYHRSVPDWLLPFLEVPEMQRLKDIGMNCGCEYTGFPPFRQQHSYSRWDHSVGTALIVWHYTEEPQQTLSALFHDISTPTFAHAVDFLRGDHRTQEATESGTLATINANKHHKPIVWNTPAETSFSTVSPLWMRSAPSWRISRLERTKMGRTS